MQIFVDLSMLSQAFGNEQRNGTNKIQWQNRYVGRWLIVRPAFLSYLVDRYDLETHFY